MKVLIAAVALLFGVLGKPTPDEKKAQWDSFKSTYNKQYESKVEESFRMKIFLDNLDTINAHNKKYESGHSTHTLGVNQFSDMLAYEFRQMLPPFNTNDLNLTNVPVFCASADLEVPDSKDWREEGAVTPVKFQDSCGSCWSFSSTGAVEGQIFRSTGQLISFSEQNLVDCSTQFGNQGCHGGWPQNSFQYIQSNGGLDTEESYPYENQEDQCRYNPQNSGGTVNGFQVVQSGDEEGLKAAVGTVGPVSVAVDASGFRQYHGGIMDNPSCSTRPDHAILVVGYGTESGVDYWIIKNSWGERWGERGYARMSRNKDNQCGIASYASYPTV